MADNFICPQILCNFTGKTDECISEHELSGLYSKIIK